jgi:hypothetical protein
VISSLFIFGLEEGWETGDCIYFAVVTLTTAGLGDFVPTSAANKMICSMFIYFGVACIGLLLGTYIAGMMDDRARRDRQQKLIESCPNCARLKTIRESAIRAQGRYSLSTPSPRESFGLQKFSSERQVDIHSDHTARYNHPHRHASKDGSRHEASRSSLPPPPPLKAGREALGFSNFAGKASLRTSPASSDSRSESNYLLGSPVTRNILGRQGHTRHNSIDFTSPSLSAAGTPSVRRASHDNIGATTISEKGPVEPASQPAHHWTDEDDQSSTDGDSVSTTDEIVDEATLRVKTIKYVFLTLRQALVNSMVIIAVGCLGFWFIEGFSLVDSWYFTTVFLTTVG